jgi:hypothetical protein
VPCAPRAVLCKVPSCSITYSFTNRSRASQPDCGLLLWRRQCITVVTGARTLPPSGDARGLTPVATWHSTSTKIKAACMWAHRQEEQLPAARTEWPKQMITATFVGIVSKSANDLATVGL